ncbi:MAG: hypothetical protein AAGC72_01095 [Planctomycetota bacterium]
MSDLSTNITTNASGPKKASTGDVTVEQHSLKDQIEADKYLKGQTATNKSKLPIRLARIKPGGAV